MKKMLIVDDNGDLRRLMKLTFGFGKFKIFEAGDGETALSIAQAEVPDLILLDVMMPGEMDGLEVCRRIKTDPQLKLCRVIIVSGRGQEEDVAEGKDAGADYYVTKPFDPLDLIDAIKLVDEQTG